ncbi:MAG: DNA polymerase III subunit gamma/tau [Candidatus Omnitrophica bacterium]|nr:DNA polymerase III subunit gamma/tau [Candidatus Omnitrophota bacterium]MBU1127467.1 DNA polymerase III subunit gamma/tau [Candidatus Omnitrophota bacterium]MBU1785059.1 DNA polymerase III subunit gamma/tau [Candidatus Omnitrophota bacterium]
MAYQVLARKYRPQTFQDVIGQEAVTRTLKNSIDRGRVANAYIFSGPRGVGKTSVARLISKMLNCTKPEKNGPCNKCTSCVEITGGNSIDVLEIDGASNRGIDEIRTLRENVKFAPASGTFKIYIIDEVHMLTTEAFNALLKTLEEPPSHVKFIFATTEAHKVLPTIMSRCQKFDFKRIPPGMIFNRLMDIAKNEKISIDEKAALLMARSADGSLRDALVVLDQMVSFSSGKISYDDVMELLGMVHKEKIFDLADAVIMNETGRVVSCLDELINSGKDPVFIADSLLGFYRDLMVLKTAGAPTSDMAFTGDELEELKKFSEKMSIEEIIYVLQNLARCLDLMKGTMFTRAPLEVTLIKLAGRRNVMALPEIIRRLEALEKGEAPRRFSKNIPSVMEKKNDPAGNNIDTSNDEQRDMPVAFKDLDAAVPGESVIRNGDAPDEKAAWQAIMGYIRNKKMSVFTFLDHASPVEVNSKKVIIGFGKDHVFNKEVLETGDNKELIAEAAASVLGKSPRLEFRVLEFMGESREDAGIAQKRKDEARKASNPIIEKAMDVFGGRIVQDQTEGI